MIGNGSQTGAQKLRYLEAVTDAALSRLGLEEFDFGVYQAWAPAHEIRDLHEQRI